MPASRTIYSTASKSKEKREKNGMNHQNFLIARKKTRKISTYLTECLHLNTNLRQQKGKRNIR